ncbi:MAG TPA: HD domain-containing protein [Candidatus Binatia bacterium]|nr:HD domain-containing protein [Candidatus Binatia bacterium]
MTEPLADLAAIDVRLAAVLPAGSLFAVGGRVRDELRSELDGIPRPVKDLDYVATGIGLDALVERLANVGRAEVAGASFPVVKCIIEGVTVDVALPRRERSTGVGHRAFALDAAGPDVSLEEDLARRDFRMNMLARAIPSGGLVDPYEGAADIAARRIDILRPEAFVEDPLRMLRACQFAARFEFALTPATMEAMRAVAPLVATVSAERIHDELVKLLADASRPSIGIELMRTGGVLAHVVPELLEGVGVDQNEWHAYDVYRHSLETLDATPPGDLVLRVAALLHDVGKPRTKEGPHFYRHEVVGQDVTRSILERLRFSNDETEQIARLVREHMYVAAPELSDRAIRRFVRRVGQDELERQFQLRRADIVGSGLPKRGDSNERFERRVQAILAERPPLSVRDLAVDGQDALRALGAEPTAKGGDRRVGPLLQAVLERVLDEPTLPREAQLEILRLQAAKVPRGT